MQGSMVLMSPPIIALAGALMTGATLFGDAAAPDRSPPRPEVSDEELRAFTRASLEIDQIRVAYQLALAEAVKTLADEASVEIHGAFERQKITIGDYGRIGQAVAQDPSLRQKVNRMARDEVEKQERRQGPEPKAPPSRPAPPRRTPPPAPSGDLLPPGELTFLQVH